MYAHLVKSSCARTVFRRRYLSSRSIARLLLSRESISPSDLENPQPLGRADAQSPQASIAPIMGKAPLETWLPESPEQDRDIIGSSNSTFTSAELDDLLFRLSSILRGLETAVAATARLGTAQGALYASSFRLQQRAEKLKGALRVIEAARRGEGGRGFEAELLGAVGDSSPATSRQSDLNFAPGLDSIGILLDNELQVISMSCISRSSVPSALSQPSFAAVPSYRDEASYTLLHFRLLEAMEARDLGSVLELFNTNSIDRNLDILSFEIAFDACARAGRADLAFGFLWPRLLSKRVEITPALRFLLLKAASLAGRLDLTIALHEQFCDSVDSSELESLSAHAAISCAVACDNFGVAVDLFNVMRKRGVQASSAIFATLFNGALKSCDSRANCRLVWRAIERSPSVAISPDLYNVILTAFASQGNLEDLGAAWRRMARKVDGALAPTSSALLAMLRAFVEAGDSSGASSVAAALEPHLASGEVSRSRVDDILGAVREADVLKSSRVKSASGRIGARHTGAVAEQLF